MEKKWEIFKKQVKVCKELNIKQLFEKNDFEYCMKLVQDNKKIKPLWKILIYIENNQIKELDNIVNHSCKILLSAYMIQHFPKEILSSNRNEIEEEVFTNSVNLTNDFEIVMDICSKDNWINLITEWYTKFIKFTKFFVKWKNADVQSQIEVYTKSYYELEVMFHSIEDSDGKKQFWETQTKKLQKQLRTQVRLLGGKEGEKFLDNYKYTLVLVDNQSLRKQVEQNVHKAYWDKCREALSKTPPSFDFLVNLLREIVDTIEQRIIPNRKDIHKKFKETIDIPYIEHMIKHNVLDIQKIVSYATFIISYVNQLGAAQHIKETEEWFQNILTQLEPPKVNNFSLPDFLVDLFKGIMERIERIVKETEQFRKNISKLNTKEI